MEKNYQGDIVYKLIVTKGLDYRYKVTANDITIYDGWSEAHAYKAIIDNENIGIELKVINY